MTRILAIKNKPRHARAHTSIVSTLFANILVTSMMLVSWQMFSSISISMAKTVNNWQAQPQQLADMPTRLNSTDATQGGQETLRWQKYHNVYNYKAPDSPFQGSSPICGNGPDYGEYFALDSSQRSRFSEDQIIYKSFFKDRLTGSGAYVELGAFDGMRESNTRFFDMCLGWNGLLIEGNPDTYRQTVANRPNAHRMSFAPSCQEESSVKFYQYPMANSGLEGKAVTYTGKPTVEVPCGPLGTVLEDMFHGQTINFFSLDVEGSEPMVLETIDFQRVKIDVLMIEVENNHCKEGCQSRAQTRAIMERAGYKRYDFGSVVLASDVYVHPRSTFNFIQPPTNEAKAESSLATTDGSKFSRYNFMVPTSPFQQASIECGSGPDFGNFFQLSKQFRSRFDEDKIIYEKFFKGKLNGLGNYIELGAFDGIKESNTRFYDVCLGWKGLLIEGNPNTYKKTVANRPQAHRMSFAPSCNEESSVQFYPHPLENSGLEGKALTYSGKQTVDVPCGPLGPVLEDMFSGQTIDFFSLDVEGAEPMVLETIDFQKVRIDVLMIEVQNGHCWEDCESRVQTRAIMASAGYKRYDFNTLVAASDVYVHPQSPYYQLT